MARKTLFRPESNPPSSATVTSLPIPTALAAEVEFKRLHDRVDRELFALRFSDEALRCIAAHEECRARQRQAKRRGESVAFHWGYSLSLHSRTGGLHKFNHGLDDRFETWEEHAIDLCAELVKARESCGVEPGPLRDAPTAPTPHVWPPVVAREATQEERAVAAPIAVAALERMVATAEEALADSRAMLAMAKAVAGGADIPDKWTSGLEMIERVVHCSECGHHADRDEQMIEAIRTMSGHLVFIADGDYSGEDTELTAIRIEWARKIIEDHGAGNDVAAKIMSQKMA